MSRNEAKFLEISHLTKSYPPPAGKTEPAVIVSDFDLAVAKGEFVCLIGHSGCGKSTVLSIAAGLMEPTEGGVLIDDREIPGPGTDRGIVFQSPCLLPWMTALQNVTLVHVREGEVHSFEADRRLALNLDDRPARADVVIADQLVGIGEERRAMVGCELRKHAEVAGELAVDNHPAGQAERT